MKGVVQGVNARVERTIRSASGRLQSCCFLAHFFFSFCIASGCHQGKAAFRVLAAPGHLSSLFWCLGCTGRIGWFRRGLTACLRVSGSSTSLFLPSRVFINLARMKTASREFLFFLFRRLQRTLRDLPTICLRIYFFASEVLKFKNCLVAWTFSFLC